jgi:hypothetical protein
VHTHARARAHMLRAHSRTRAARFEERHSVNGIVDFLNSDFDAIMTELQETCTNCKIALTDTIEVRPFTLHQTSIN